MMNSDPFDAPMDSVHTMSPQEAAAYAAQQPEFAEDAAQHSVKEAPKTPREEQVDHLSDLLSSAKLNSWERGFCESCKAWLEKSPINQLSFKQRNVLTATVNKHFYPED